MKAPSRERLHIIKTATKWQKYFEVWFDLPGEGEHCLQWKEDTPDEIIDNYVLYLRLNKKEIPDFENKKDLIGFLNKINDQ